MRIGFIGTPVWENLSARYEKALKLLHNIAAPASMIGVSNFFELAVAVAIALFGAQSPVVLATIVGILVEVPIMLTLVIIANNTKEWFKNESKIND